MAELKMPVHVFRGDSEIGSGELVPNGASMAFCPSTPDFELLHLQADSEQVEDKIPMTFMMDSKEVGKGELYNSGEYVCLCPENPDLSLMKSGRQAKLFLDPKGLSARLEINSSKN